MGKDNMIVSSSERTIEQLHRLQTLPLEQKINLTKRRIDQFYRERNGKVYVSFSGGKDSTVLLHIVRQMFPEVKGVFCDTGLEFPEIIDFVKLQENIIWLKPKMGFKKILEKYGYPVPSKEVAQKIYEIRTTGSPKLLNKRMYGDEKGSGKIPEKWKYLIDSPYKISHKCCDIMKKNPAKIFERESGLSPIIGTMASESRLRETNWLKHGCNAFTGKRSKSNPLSFWNDTDVWEYIKKYNIPYSKIYDMGETRTGCMYCLFGCQFDDSDGWQRFKRMKSSHPRHYKVAEKLGIIDVLKYVRNEGDDPSFPIDDF